ncbi:MAG TPA: alpha/beta hydrolase [Acidimicrobiia bacterium]|nr:alpha/beta hydrolase [Acidimicrobiia bacterium]
MASKAEIEGEVAYREAETALWGSVGLSPTERRIAFPGMDGTVRLQEVGEGPATLFIHGGPNSGSTWIPILPYMPGVRAILVDRPGTGLSDSIAIESISDLERFGDHFVASVLDALELRRADIVASSLGGYLALRSAAATPERIARMVQMACPPGAPGMLTPAFMRMLSLKPVRRILGMLPFNQKVSDSILRQIGHGKTLDGGGFPQVFNDWYVALMVHTDTNRNEGELIGKGATLRGFVPEFTLVPTLPKVETPTLFLWGADDGFGKEDVARDTVGMMPNAHLEMIEDAGHLPWLDFPELVGTKTAAFLSG